MSYNRIPVPVRQIQPNIHLTKITCLPPIVLGQFEYLLQMKVAKKKKKVKLREKQLRVLMSNLIQDEYYSFFLDTAQFSHSSGERKA